MDKSYVILVIASAAVGMVIGGIIVLLIINFKEHIFSNSMTDFQLSVGQVATVSMPFDHDSKGKVAVHINQSTYECIARTYYPNKLEYGDRAIVVEIEDNYVWVFPWHVETLHKLEELIERNQ